MFCSIFSLHQRRSSVSPAGLRRQPLIDPETDSGHHSRVVKDNQNAETLRYIIAVITQRLISHKTSNVNFKTIYNLVKYLVDVDTKFIMKY